MRKSRKGRFNWWLAAGITLASAFVFTILFVLLDSISAGVIIDWLFWMGETLPYLVVQQKALVFIVGLLLIVVPLLLAVVVVYRVSERRAEEKADEKLQVVLDSIDNIIKNCVEHNREGGNIFITYEENNLYTKISIKDEGEGISQEEIKNIFKRFYKGKNSSENSIGIGLSLAKNIIEKDNGLITCKSELGEGTEFIIKYMKS